MELAGRVFDTITSEQNVSSDVRDLVPEIASSDERNYWRRVLRMAALCHDIGHLPFSHAAEDELLPSGWSHERLSRLLIESDVMASIWKDMRPPLNPEHIVKVAIGARSAKDLNFTKWERILSEIIVGDAFAESTASTTYCETRTTRESRTESSTTISLSTRSESCHLMKVQPSRRSESTKAESIPSEALMLARYFMFSQVYYHLIRRIYTTVISRTFSLIG